MLNKNSSRELPTLVEASGVVVVGRRKVYSKQKETQGCSLLVELELEEKRGGVQVQTNWRSEGIIHAGERA